MSWVKRVEDVLDILKGSSIGEIELSEGEYEIILRRTPGIVVAGKQLSSYDSTHTAPAREYISDRGTTAITAPLTGVYYSAPTPAAAPFVVIGDTVKVGQPIALIEAMKVFNEIQAEVAGRVIAVEAQNGDIVKKGAVLLRVEPV